MRNRNIDNLLAAAHLPTGRPESEPSQSVQAAVRQRFDRSRQVVEQFIIAHPIIFLGAAVASGIALGWWVKRKK